LIDTHAAVHAARRAARPSCVVRQGRILLVARRTPQPTRGLFRRTLRTAVRNGANRTLPISFRPRQCPEGVSLSTLSTLSTKQPRTHRERDEPEQVCARLHQQVPLRARQRFALHDLCRRAGCCNGFGRYCSVIYCVAPWCAVLQRGVLGCNEVDRGATLIIVATCRACSARPVPCHRIQPRGSAGADRCGPVTPSACGCVVRSCVSVGTCVERGRG
jgi:hypothetical protein